MLALLAARFGDLDLADESVQDALVQAVETWPTQGIPDNPAGWLYAVAHNRGVDRLRRRASASRRLHAAAPDLVGVADAADAAYEQEGEVQIVEASEVGDEQLRLMLLCCHPALDRDTQVALTLRLLGGLTTAEIAAAYLLPEATLAQRIVRAKRKIRDARIPLTIPADLSERVAALLTVLYLVFNEGYLARGTHDSLVRVELADEAIRLTETAVDLLAGLPDAPEVAGLLALELYLQSRVSTRVDGAGDLVQLEQQDRSRWDGATITRANEVLKGAVRAGRLGVYQLQALIASQHANARTADDTDWPLIVSLYEQLMRLTPSPVVALNHAVAVAMADGPRAGLALLDKIEGLDGYHLSWATRGELLHRSGDEAGAHAAFDRAHGLTSNPAERRHLQRRLAATRSEPGSGT
ncbi:sigma factor [soil metagenome]